MNIYINGWVAGYGVDQERFAEEAGANRMFSYADLREDRYRIMRHFLFHVGRENENLLSWSSGRRLG